jgi:precorrin-6B methylase 2
MNLKTDDVFCDLGSGTGKIVLQVSEKTKCAKAIGVELVYERHAAAVRLLGAPNNDRVQFIHGDLRSTKLDQDVTVVFVNNVLFPAELTMALMCQLATLPKLRMVITLRQLCARHRESMCSRKGTSPCCLFNHPLRPSGVVWPSWTSETSMFVYGVNKQ